MKKFPSNTMRKLLALTSVISILAIYTETSYANDTQPKLYSKRWVNGAIGESRCIKSTKMGKVIWSWSQDQAYWRTTAPNCPCEQTSKTQRFQCS